MFPAIMYVLHLEKHKMQKIKPIISPLKNRPSMKNPPVQTIYVHVHHSNFQIVLENYTMEKKICLLAILCVRVWHNLAQTKIDNFFVSAKWEVPNSSTNEV